MEGLCGTWVWRGLETLASPDSGRLIPVGCLLIPRVRPHSKAVLSVYLCPDDFDLQGQKLTRTRKDKLIFLSAGSGTKGKQYEASLSLCSPSVPSSTSADRTSTFQKASPLPLWTRACSVGTAGGLCGPRDHSSDVF